MRRFLCTREFNRHSLWVTLQWLKGMSTTDVSLREARLKKLKSKLLPLFLKSLMQKLKWTARRVVRGVRESTPLSSSRNNLTLEVPKEYRMPCLLYSMSFLHHGRTEGSSSRKIAYGNTFLDFENRSRCLQRWHRLRSGSTFRSSIKKVSKWRMSLNL